eukprot:gene11450-17615_t
MTNVILVGHEISALAVAKKLGKEYLSEIPTPDELPWSVEETQAPNNALRNAVLEVKDAPGCIDTIDWLKSHGAVVVWCVLGKAAAASEPCPWAAIYDVRVLIWDGDQPGDIVNNVSDRVQQCPWFTSTRGCGGAGYDFLKVVRSGIAPDGGLFIPLAKPKFSLNELAGLAANCSSYVTLAQFVLEKFIPFMPYTRGLTPQELHVLLKKAYSAERWEAPEACPVVPLRAKSEARARCHVLELFHGPTAAFKDFALQVFPQFFAKSVASHTSQYVILAATSGDTGVAAINGFMHERDIAVMVLYPKHGVSAVQKAQMLRCECEHVRVLGVDADFDFCQATVKRIFNDGAFKAKLLAEEDAMLSSANSINWGRLLPQIVYYVWGYTRLVAKGEVSNGEPVDVVVPTGNFGNILSAYCAKLAGVPIRTLVCASNENNVLADFIKTGTYDISNRALKVTSSPSIDILVSSNVERFLFLLSDGDSKLVSDLMRDLETTRTFTLPDNLKEKLQQHFVAGSCSEADCLATIKSVQEEHSYLVDTHTAVAYKVMQDYRSTVETAAPILLASTASFAKFPDAVKEALDGKTVPSHAPYDPNEVYAAITKATGAQVPRALQGIQQVPDSRCCAKDEAAIKDALKTFCGELRRG